MNATENIFGTDEAWESGKLGADEKSARPVDPEIEKGIDESLGLQMISIRLDKGLIESFKMIGEFHGIGYQPLMRDALRKFAEGEMKSIVLGVVESQRKNRAEKPAAHKPTTAKARKAA